MKSIKNKNAISQYVRDDSSSHKSTPCPTRLVTHTLTPDMTPNKPIINRVQENMNNIHDDEEHAFTLDRDDIPEEELEDGLLQENPGAIVDCKLIVNGVCIRSAMEKWRKSSKYVEEFYARVCLFLFLSFLLYDYTPWLLFSNENFILQFNALQYYRHNCFICNRSTKALRGALG